MTTVVSNQVASQINHQQEKQREDPQKPPGNPLPNKPTTPAKSDKYPDHTKPRPGGNEPEKTDPTRIDEPPPAKPEPPKNK
jgi:hypothetical protein